jgi:hypothetical protein
LEPYKEIVNLKEYHFFTGYADLKYGANYNRYRSEKTNDDHFIHRLYYDIEIYSVSKLLTGEEFKKWEPNFQLSRIKDNLIIVHFEGKEYGVNADVVYLNESFGPDHVQREGDELHGDFAKVPVAFKIHKKSLGFRCIPNYPTGNIEFREDGEYHEYTTGGIEPDGETCSTEWRKKPIEIKCPKDQPTGSREDKENCYRLEYFSGQKSADGTTCLTYWGEWICDGKPNCEKDKATGRRQERGNCYRLEYYTGELKADGKSCETYWGEWECEDRPPGCLSGIGCLGILFWLIALVWAFFCIKWAIDYGSFLPILFGIGIPLLLAGLGYVINFLGRYAIGIGRVFRWIMNLVLLIVILSLLNGLFNFFGGADSRRDYLPKADTSYDDQDVVDVDPQNDRGDGRVPDPGDSQRQFKRVHLKWSGFEGQRYKGSFDVRLDHLRQSSYNLKRAQGQQLNSYALVYQTVHDKDKNYLNGLYNMLDSIRSVNGQTRNQFAKTIVSMVQSINYVLILEQSCDDRRLLQNRNLRQMLLEGVPCEGYAPYGIKTPTEFLTSMKGDCDTRTLLLYTIFKHYGYDVAILNSEYYGHSMLGLSIEGINGAYKSLGNSRYYFWETTDKGYYPGQLAREMGMLNYWKIEIN